MGLSEKAWTSMPAMRSILLGILSISTVRGYYIGEVYSGQAPETFDYGWKPDWRGKSYVNRCIPLQRNIGGTAQYLQGIGVINGAEAPGRPPFNPGYGISVPDHNVAALILYKSPDCVIDGTDQFIILRFKQLSTAPSRELGYVLYRGVSSMDLTFLDVNLEDYWAFREVQEGSDDWKWVVESRVPEVDGAVVVWQLGGEDGQTFEIVQTLEIRSPNPVTAKSISQSLERNDVEPAIGNLRVALRSISENRYVPPRAGGNIVRIPSRVLNDYPLAQDPNPNPGLQMLEGMAQQGLSQYAPVDRTGGANPYSNVTPVQIPSGRTLNIRTGLGSTPPTGANANIRSANPGNTGVTGQNQDAGQGTGGDTGAHPERGLMSQLFRQQQQQQQQQARGTIPIQPRPDNNNMMQGGNRPQQPYYEMMQPRYSGSGNLQGQMINPQNMARGGSRGTSYLPAYPQNFVSQPPQNLPEQGSRGLGSNYGSVQNPISQGNNPISQIVPQGSQVMIPEAVSDQNIPEPPTRIIPEVDPNQIIPEAPENLNLAGLQNPGLRPSPQIQLENPNINIEAPQQREGNLPVDEQIPAGPTDDQANSLDFGFTSFPIPDVAPAGTYGALLGKLPQRVQIGGQQAPRFQRIMTAGRIGGPTSPTLFDRNLDIDPAFDLSHHTGLNRLHQAFEDSAENLAQIPYPSTDTTQERPYSVTEPPKRGQSKYPHILEPGTQNRHVPYQGWLNEGEFEERAHFPQLFENPSMELEADLAQQQRAEAETPPQPGGEDFQSRTRSRGQELYDDWRRYGNPILGNLQTLPINWADPNWAAIKQTYDAMLADVEGNWYNYYQERTDAMMNKYKQVQGAVQKTVTVVETARAKHTRDLTAAQAKTKAKGLTLNQQVALIKEIQGLQKLIELDNKKLETLKELWASNNSTLRTWERSYHRQLDDLVLRFNLWKDMARENIERNILRLLHIDEDPEFGMFEGEVPRNLDQ
ncbi:hypothetical protein TWF481_010660 [Arthrobotrys musiformis]|uniref:Uncharacterized protein n=1 Tax=Arthrobotrys musiformis TaxID=47236 RepID=A0AAV9W3L1_9PEZI